MWSKLIVTEFNITTFIKACTILTSCFRGTCPVELEIDERALAVTLLLRLSGAACLAVWLFIYLSVYLSLPVLLRMEQPPLYSLSMTHFNFSVPFFSFLNFDSSFSFLLFLSVFLHLLPHVIAFHTSYSPYYGKLRK